MQLHGMHHVTAVSADASGNHAFYTQVLGMRLVKRTVNQDDVSAYHLFYADGEARPGTDLTFFNWPVGPEQRGTNAIVGTTLRVSGAGTFTYWADRLSAAGIRAAEAREIDGRLTLEFQDPEGQRLALLDDHGEGAAFPWAASPVPPEHQIRGLGPVHLSVPDLHPSDPFLTEVMAMRRTRTYVDPERPRVTVQVYEMDQGGLSAELHVRVEPDLAPAQPGAGGVHHVAFRVSDDAEYRAWIERFQQLGIRFSGPIDRYYFQSLYTRGPNNILYEIATDGPGFAADESADTLGERLALPPFLEPRRTEIERGLKPL